MSTKKNVILSLLLLLTIVISHTLCIIIIVNKEIQAFYQSYDIDGYKNLRYDLLKTIVYTQVVINKDGSLTRSDNYDPSYIISYSHDRKVKVVLMFQGIDSISKDTILANQRIRAVAINNLLDEVKKYNFDGIDIDLESLNLTNSVNGQSNKKLMTDFVGVLSDKFRRNNNYRISMDIGNNYNDTEKIFDLSKLQYKVDYIMIMGYDIYGGLAKEAGPNSPIRLDNGQGIYDSIKHYKGFVNRKKLLLGVPWYGWKFATTNGNRLAIVNNGGKYIPYKNCVDIDYNYTRKWDSVWQTPWYTYKDNMTSQWYQIHCDDVQSLGIKYDLVNAEKIAGIGIWSINYGTNNTEMWQLIQKKFGTYTIRLI